MGFLRRQLAKLQAPDPTAEIIRRLDQYHGVWADFNREIEGRVAANENLAVEVAQLKERIDALERGRNALRTDCEALFEQVSRMLHRIRMRYVRGGADEENGSGTAEEPDDPNQQLLLRRKGF